MKRENLIVMGSGLLLVLIVAIEVAFAIRFGQSLGHTSEDKLLYSAALAISVAMLTVVGAASAHMLKRRKYGGALIGYAFAAVLATVTVSTTIGATGFLRAANEMSATSVSTRIGELRSEVARIDSRLQAIGTARASAAIEAELKRFPRNPTVYAEIQAVSKLRAELATALAIADLERDRARVVSDLNSSLQSNAGVVSASKEQIVAISALTGLSMSTVSKIMSLMLPLVLIMTSTILPYLMMHMRQDVATAVAESARLMPAQAETSRRPIQHDSSIEPGPGSGTSKPLPATEPDPGNVVSLKAKKNDPQDRAQEKAEQGRVVALSGAESPLIKNIPAADKELLEAWLEQNVVREAGAFERTYNLSIAAARDTGISIDARAFGILVANRGHMRHRLPTGERGFINLRYVGSRESFSAARKTAAG